jgi:hypothetical protein
MMLRFEPEIVSPDDPYEAAIIFFAVIAYPEEGAGAAGQPGSVFANALVSYCLWACSKARGLAFLREQRNDPAYRAPRKRDFQGSFDRGMRRIRRRIAAYDLFGTQLFHGFFAVRALGAKAIREGRAAEAFHLDSTGSFGPAMGELWAQGTPSARRLIGRAERHWSDRFSVNVTGAPADPAQKTKDIHRRAFVPSIPVLHMVHAMNECARTAGPTINGWGKRDPVTALLLNFDKWIWDALEIAEQWRTIPHFPGGLSLKATDMIALKREAADSR